MADFDPHNTRSMPHDGDDSPRTGRRHAAQGSHYADFDGDDYRYNDDYEHRSSGTVWRIIGVIAIVVLAVGVIAYALTRQANGDNDPTHDPDVPALSQEMKDMLTVKDGDDLWSGDTANGLVPLDYEARIDVQNGNPAKRQWSDALALPVDGQNGEVARDQTQTTVFHDPLVGCTYGHMFAHLKVGDASILDLNPWLLEFNRNDGEINDCAKAFRPSTAKGTDEEYENAYKQNLKYQLVARKLNTLLDRFQVAGIEPRPSHYNYRLAGGGLSVSDDGTPPEVEVTTELDDKPAVILQVTSKTAGPCEVPFAIGINVGDKRPELFDTLPANSACAPTPTTTAPPPPGTPPPGTTPPGTTPPTTTRTTTCCVTTTTTTTSTTTTPPNTAKPPTHNPSQPPGETQHTAPPGPPETAPPPPPATTFNPTLPTDAPPVSQPNTTRSTPAPAPEVPTETNPSTDFPDPGES